MTIYCFRFSEEEKRLRSALPTTTVLPGASQPSLSNEQFSTKNPKGISQTEEVRRLLKEERKRIEEELKMKKDPYKEREKNHRERLFFKKSSLLRMCFLK